MGRSEDLEWNRLIWIFSVKCGEVFGEVQVAGDVPAR
jgi:hypothetical protein